MEGRYPLVTSLVASTGKAKVACLVPSSGRAFQIYGVRAENNSGVTQNVGILRKMANYHFFSLSSSGTVLTDNTASLQAGNAVQAFDTMDADGFIVTANRPIGVLGMTVSSTAATPNISAQYWNGVTWNSISSFVEPFPSLSQVPSSDAYMVQLAAPDWVPGSNVGTPQAQYALKITSTPAPAAQVKFTNMWVGEFLEFRSRLADAGQATLSFDTFKPLPLEAGESIMGYFPTASTANTVLTQFGLSG